VPQWREVDVRGVRVERLRQFGRVDLGLALWRRLGLHSLLREFLPTRPHDGPGEVRLRGVARPEKPLAQLLAHLGLELPKTPRNLGNVVQKTAP
jgi:hypothetical protein